MAALLYTAEIVWPITASALRDGGVLVEGDRITAVGEAGVLRRGAAREIHVEGVLLPALVDASTAVEVADEALAGDPATWSDERWRRSARHGVQLLLRAGVAVAADRVVRGAGVPAAGRAGLLGDALIAVNPPSGSRDDAAEDGSADPAPAAALRKLIDAVEAALQRSAHGRRSGLIVSASADEELLIALGGLTAHRRAPLHLDGATGQIPRLARLGVLRPGVRVSGLHPADEPHLAIVGRAGAAVVIRPRVDAVMPALGALVEAGVSVAVGSGGAVPDPLADAGALAGHDRSADPAALLELVTAASAAALGWPAAGALAVGARADFVGVTLPDGPPRPASGRLTPALAEALVHDGAGRQHLTVLAGVRRARREPDGPWPALDDHTLPAPSSTTRPSDHDTTDHDTTAAQGAR